LAPLRTADRLAPTTLGRLRVVSLRAAGGAQVPRRWGSAKARRSSASPMTWCSASVCTHWTARGWGGADWPQTGRLRRSTPTFSKPSRTPRRSGSGSCGTRQRGRRGSRLRLTFSLSKSISLFHASLGENARRAYEDGDSEAEAFWAGEIAALDEMIYAANRATLEFFQAQAGHTRLGAHAGRVKGRETGEWREADLAVASWYQHTSRDGDPQLHMHNQILHAALTSHDGKWRAPDLVPVQQDEPPPWHLPA
jgi:hypothetical protein